MTQGHSTTVSGDIVEVTAPASDSLIEVFRGTAHRVPRIAGMSNEAIEDLSLAVDEAAMLLLECEPTEVAMSMAVFNPGPPRRLDRSGLSGSLAPSAARI